MQDARLTATHSALRARRCSIYLFDPYKHLRDAHPRRLPVGWELNQLSTATWLQRSLSHHPWRTHSIDQADAVFIGVDFSALCRPVTERAERWTAQRALWNQLVQQRQLWRPDGTRPVVISRQQQACAAPWANRRETDTVIQLYEYHRSPRSRRAASGIGLATPFVIASPEWLASGSRPGGELWASAGWARSTPRPKRKRWADRKLLLFTGHVPKLYQSNIRYRLWQGLRLDPRVTTQSRSINCTIGQFAACREAAEPMNLSAAWLSTYCRPYCGSASSTHLGLRTREPSRCSADITAPAGLHQSRLRFRKLCHSYRDVDFGSELPQMHRDSSESWSKERYLQEAMGHRFCLVAQGDFVGTPKLTEMMAIGSAGGCIPLIVLPERRESVSQVLPYLTWLDYCAAVFFASTSVVSDHTALTRLLTSLEQITPKVARAKHAALEAIRNAFVTRHNSSLAAPSAPEFILGEVCDAVRQFRSASSAAERERIPEASWSTLRCTLP